jgi:Ca-activated chloride channel homolog
MDGARWLLISLSAASAISRRRTMMKRTSVVLALALASLSVLFALTQSAAITGKNPPPPKINTIALPPQDEGAVNTAIAKYAAEQSDGALRTVESDGKVGAFCPLQHTDVQAEITGFLARVTVTQEFVNPSNDRVEAIYTFPLPQNAAVDDMTMLVGGRTIKGLIKKREEAQKIYQDAKNAGHTAALLDQERPNIFTQSVANIPANAPVKVVISYVETLKYEAGVYEFVYPMVVGPRYIPGNPTGKQAGGWSPDTDKVPDASRITPITAQVHFGKQGTRAGHDISLAVKLDAGVPIHELNSALHAVDIQNTTSHSAVVKLRSENEIPNRDFVLRYDVAGNKVEDALLTHAGADASLREARGGADTAATRGFFTFILQPPDRVRDEDATPRELVFVLDTSGSMMGYPIETAKKVMRRAIQNMRAGDTFNLITFAGDTHILFPQPVDASAANIQKAIKFLDGQRGGGGTEMMKAIRAALGNNVDCGPNAECDGRHTAGIRVVCFMTDGYVGDDMTIIGEVQKHPEARVFSFGIGSSVNRFLLDGMARAGRGEVEYVLNDGEAPGAAERFYERVHTPVLTDITIDWGGLPVADVMPAKPLDLFTAKPLVITGRYTNPAVGTIKLRGKQAGKPFERAIRVNLPAQELGNQSLAQLWARTKISEIMAIDWNGIQNGSPQQDVREQITQLGLDYRLMTQFTSFVAVEEQTVVEGGQTRTIQVPVELAQGLDPRGFKGEGARAMAGNVGVGSAAGVGAGYFYSASRAPSTVQVPINGATETVEVTAEAPTINTQSSQLSMSVGAGDEIRAEGPPIFKSKAERDEAKRQKDAKLRITMQAKLHTALLSAYDCWKQSAGKSACAGVNKQGTVKIKLWLTHRTPQFDQELVTLGFAAAPRIGNQGNVIAGNLELVGEIDIAKLPRLAELTEVKLIGLQR